MTISVDARVAKDNWVGIGAIGRDHMGKVQMAAVQYLTCSICPLWAEAMGILFGVLRALQMGWKWVRLESDSLTFINILKEGSQAGYGLRTIIKDIRHFCKRFEQLEWVHLKREANTVAHNMAAKDPHCRDGARMWMSDFPMDILQWTHSDITHLHSSSCLT